MVMAFPWIHFSELLDSGPKITEFGARWRVHSFGKNMNIYIFAFQSVNIWNDECYLKEDNSMSALGHPVFKIIRKINKKSPNELGK